MALNQDPFPFTIDLNAITQFRISSNHNTFKGLFVKNSTGTGGSQAQHLFVEGPGSTVRIDTTLSAMKLDGGNTACPGSVCTDGYALFAAAFGNGQQTVTMNNVEGSSAVNAALDLQNGCVGTVYNSWIHNNHQANIHVSQPGATNAVVSAQYSTIEQAGFRTDGVMPGNAVPGIKLSGDGNTVSTGQSVIRNNSADGIQATDLSNVSPQGDYFCGNGVSRQWNGLTSTAGINGSPSVSGTGGVVTAYNQGHGVSAASAGGSVVSLNNDSAFTANALCGVNPINSATISVQNDQWREAAPPFSDVCSGGFVDTTGYRSPRNEAMSLLGTPTFPSDVIRKGQTVRVLGNGFNSIDGNPVAPAGVNCTTGVASSGSKANSCCNQPTKANTCSGTHTPASGNCVELMGTSGKWEQLSVSAVTPQVIVAQIPDTTFGCVGTLGEEVAVTKQTDSGPAVRTGFYCTNAAQP